MFIKNPIHEKIKYSDFFKTQSRAVCLESNITKTQIKLLAHKTWYSANLAYLLKDKAIKEFVSEMDIITNSPTKEIIRHNKCQMRFLDKLVMK